MPASTVLTPLDDAAIVELYWQRSETAIRATAAKYGSYCTAIARSILHSGEDAEECVNDTWLRAWNAIPPSRPAKLSAFLGKITRNLCLDRYLAAHAAKRGGGETAAALSELEDCLPASGTVESASDNKALAEALNRFLATLPTQTRVLFVRRYWYLLPVKTIAAQMHLNENTAASTLARTRKALKTFLEQEGIEV